MMYGTGDASFQNVLYIRVLITVHSKNGGKQNASNISFNEHRINTLFTFTMLTLLKSYIQASVAKAVKVLVA